MTTLHKAKRDTLIYLLRDYGFTYREIGHLFGISRQRACQIFQDIEDGYEPIITNNEERLRLKKVKPYLIATKGEVYRDI